MAQRVPIIPSSPPDRPTIAATMMRVSRARKCLLQNLPDNCPIPTTYSSRFTAPVRVRPDHGRARPDCSMASRVFHPITSHHLPVQSGRRNLPRCRVARTLVRAAENECSIGTHATALSRWWLPDPKCARARTATMILGRLKISHEPTLPKQFTPQTSALRWSPVKPGATESQ